MRSQNPKGQTMIEYLILFTAVVAVLLVFLFPRGIFHGALGRSMNITLNQIDVMANQMNYAF